MMDNTKIYKINYSDWPFNPELAVVEPRNEYVERGLKQLVNCSLIRPDVAYFCCDEIIMFEEFCTVSAAEHDGGTSYDGGYCNYRWRHRELYNEEMYNRG